VASGRGATLNVASTITPSVPSAPVCSFGTSRDWLIGIEIVDARGRRVRGGGKVVKNVTGYDLPKLHTGALGTLGVIVEATFKVAPRPEATRGLLLTAAKLEFVTRLHEETAPAMSLLRETGAGRVLAVIYTGYEEVVEAVAARAQALAESFGESPTTLPAGMPAPFTGIPPETALHARVTGPRAASATRHAALTAAGPWAQADSLPGVGVADLYLRPDADPEGAWRQLVEWGLRGGVGVAALHAPAEMRRDFARVNLWSPIPPTLPLQQRLKAAFDPARTLNPGRFIGGI
jgi:glycolate oxidase FAD binding subunit